MVVRSTGELIAKLASVAFYVVVARELGEAPFGVFFFGLSLSAVLLMAAGLGTNELITREVAKDPRRYHELFPQVITVKRMLLAALWLLIGLIVLAGGYRGESALAIMVIATGVAIETQSWTLHAVFQARERQQYIAASLIVQRTATAGAGIAVVLAGGGLLAAASTYLGGSVLGLGVSYFLLYRRIGRARGRVDVSGWPAILRVSVPLGLATVLYLGLIRLDAILLGFLAADKEVGEYGAAYRLVDATMFISWSFTGAIIPWFSRHRGEDQRLIGLARGFELGLKGIVAVVLPVGLLYVLFAPELIGLLYGQGFDGSASVLRLLGGVTIMFAINFYVQDVLIARGRPVEFIRAAIIVIPLNLAFNFVLIPKYGADGAAFNALLSGVLFAALTVPRTAGSFGGVRYATVAGAPLLAGGLMVAVSVLLTESASWPVAGLAGVTTYATTFLIVERIFSPEDFRLLRTLIPRLSRDIGGSERKHRAQ